MLDAVCAHKLTKNEKNAHKEPSPAEMAGMVIGAILLVFAWVLAIIKAVKKQNTSVTQSADILFAWMSPISFWVLHWVGALAK
jgi:hypothetical protein